MLIRTLLVGTIASLTAAPVLAGPVDPGDDRIRVRRAATILFSDDPSLIPEHEGVGFDLVAPWLAQNLRFDQRGLKYVGRFGKKGKDRVVLRVRGPLMSHKRLGISVDVRF